MKKNVFFMIFMLTLVFSGKGAQKVVGVSCPLGIDKPYKAVSQSSIYYITSNCTKRVFTSPSIFFSHFSSWAVVKTTDRKTLESIPTDPVSFMATGPLYTPKNGALIKAISDPKVYVVLEGKINWITSPTVFEILYNNRWNFIENVEESVILKFVRGEEIVSVDEHPLYTLVKYGDTPEVYQLLLDPSGSGMKQKKHIKNESEFARSGFSWDRIVTIARTEVYPDWGVALSKPSEIIQPSPQPPAPLVSKSIPPSEVQSVRVKKPDQSGEIHTMTLEKNTMYNLEKRIQVSSAGDIMVEQNGFARFHTSFSPLSLGSNAGILSRGQGGFGEVVCPKFLFEKLGHSREGDFQYFNWWTPGQFSYLPYSEGENFCVVNHDTSRYFQVQVVRVNSNGSVDIQYRNLGSTGVKTYDCDDGICTNQVAVACTGCTEQDKPFLRETRNLLAKAKICLEDHLKTSLPDRLGIFIRNSSSVEEDACSGDTCENHGHGGSYINNYGFQGVSRKGETRVSRVDDLRFELHEVMHVYNRQMLGYRVPSWFDEGIAIATGEIDCRDEKYMREGYQIGTNEYERLRDGSTALTEFQRNGHIRGSLFFYGLKTDYGCGAACVSRVWNRLVDNSSGPQDEVTAREIKQAVEDEVGKSVSPLFNLLQISYSE